MIATVQDRGKADLHVHSTHSDGMFSPAEIIDRAKQAKLSAIAITDHDTIQGFLAARDLAQGIELVPGVEITTAFHDREFHLLAYFFDPEDSAFTDVLNQICVQRSERFEAIIGRLRGVGLSIEAEAVRDLQASGTALGRRHLARLLIESRQARSYYDAFSRFLNAPDIQRLPKVRIPVADAIELVRGAGGVTSWAHPPADASIEQMRELQSLGLNAVECEYPYSKGSHGRKLRQMAGEVGLEITGGSDCHGPQPNNRAIGARGISRVELDRLRDPRGSQSLASGLG
ncbi:MAG: PHP domain-containing protein, partial [Planctomycetes bacterium]|nr:PHP domain-containing protein [Planctomycetota bacterium]